MENFIFLTSDNLRQSNRPLHVISDLNEQLSALFESGIKKECFNKKHKDNLKIILQGHRDMSPSESSNIVR